MKFLIAIKHSIFCFSCCWFYCFYCFHGNMQTMGDDALAKAGLFFDELNKVRVLKPDTAQQSQQLKEDSVEFVEKIKWFQVVIENFIKLMDALAGQVELEKMRAIGSRNLLKTASKQREAEIQQLQMLVREKQIELERLRLQYETLQKEEREQNEFLQQFQMSS